MALKIGDDHLLRILSSGDVASNEIYYHKQNIKPCLLNFHNRYNAACKETHNLENYNDAEWLKISTLDKFYFHICEIEQIPFLR